MNEKFSPLGQNRKQALGSNSSMITNYEELWTPAKTAKYLNVKIATLATWRHKKIHLPYTKSGGRVMYYAHHVQAYAKSRICVPNPIISKSNIFGSHTEND